MPLLILIRHSLAHDQCSQGDFYRQLTDTGTALIFKTASLLRPYLIKKPVIVCSAALRAFQTAKQIAEHLNIPEDKIHADNFFYAASASQIYGRLHHFFNQAEVVMFCGHNPAVSELVNMISSLNVVLQPAEAAIIPIDHNPVPDCLLALPAVVSPY